MNHVVSPIQSVPAMLIIALTAFAANSIFCRLALEEPSIDAASFTFLRLLSGSVALVVLCRLVDKSWRPSRPALVPVSALFVYMVCFSYAYIELSAGSGALLLFGFVQLTMLGVALTQGKRMSLIGWLGLLTAMSGLAYLVSPGISAPDPVYAGLMALAGVAWGIYSLFGSSVSNATSSTTSNFIYATVLGLILSLLTYKSSHVSPQGVYLALASGIFASGLGYAVWYRVLPRVPVTSAATLQLSVPALAALGGIIFIGEPLSLRLLISVLLILGGIAVVIHQNRSDSG